MKRRGALRFARKFTFSISACSLIALFAGCKLATIESFDSGQKQDSSFPNTRENDDAENSDGSVDLARSPAPAYEAPAGAEIHYLESGKTYSTLPIKNGASKERPYVIMTRGYPSARPAIVNTERVYNKPLQHVHFVGVEFVGTQEREAFRMVGYSKDVEWRDCIIRNFGHGLLIQQFNSAAPEDIRIIGSYFLSNWDYNDSHNQGIFTVGVDGLHIERNVFDINGWHPDHVDRTMFNHNMYLVNGNKITIRNNLILRGSLSGIKLATDKDPSVVQTDVLIEDNFLMGNANAIGTCNHATHVCIKDFIIRRNAITRQGGVIEAGAAKFGYEIKNGENIYLEKNYFFDSPFKGSTYVMRAVSPGQLNVRALGTLVWGWHADRAEQIFRGEENGLILSDSVNRYDQPSPVNILDVVNVNSEEEFYERARRGEYEAKALVSEIMKRFDQHLGVDP